MRTVVATFLLLSLVGTAAAQTRRPSLEDDRQAIERLHDRDITASLALDVDKLVGLWDQEIVSMPPNSTPLAGIEANLEYLKRRREQMADVDILSYEQQWDEVRILGEYAYEYGSIKSRVKPAGASQEMTTSFNVMRVLKRQAGGDWKVYRTIWNDRNPAPPPTGASRPD